MRLRVLLTATLVLGLGAFSAEATPLIVNGGFEAVGTYPGWFTSMTAVNAPGWTIGASSEFPIIASNTGCLGAYGAGNQGCNFAVLGGGETGGTGFISQTVAGFAIGASYTLSWLQASEYVARDIMNVQIIGAATLSQNFQTNPYTAPTLWDNWTAESFNFVADAASLTFRFAGTGSTYNNCIAAADSCDVGLDAVSVASRGGAPVPEPMTMLLVGSGLAGVALRRRRSWSSEDTVRSSAVS